MSRYWKILNDPLKRDLENSEGEFEIQSELRFKISGQEYYIPNKYIANGASIPWYAQWLIPKSGKWNRPSIVHDFGYEYGGLFKENGEFIQMSQGTIDYVYLKLMESRGVKKWKRKLQYKILRMAGWRKWNHYRKKNKKYNK